MFKVLPEPKSVVSTLPLPTGITAGSDQAMPAGRRCRFYAAYDQPDAFGGHRCGSVIARVMPIRCACCTVMIVQCQCIIGIGVVSMRETPGIGDKILTDQDSCTISKHWTCA